MMLVLTENNGKYYFKDSNISELSRDEKDEVIKINCLIIIGFIVGIIITITITLICLKCISIKSK